MTQKPRRTKPALTQKTRLRQVHTWVGLLASVSILILSITGLYLNHQETWESTTSHPFEQKVTALTASPTTPHELWIGTANGLYHTVDNGQTFRKITTKYPAKKVVDITVDESGTLIVALESGLILMKPSQNVWSRVSAPPVDYELTQLTINQQQQLHAITDKGLFSSEPPYTKWTQHQNNPYSHSLAYTMKKLHSGYWNGTWLVTLHDLSTVGLLLLIGSGLWIYIRTFKRPKRPKK